MRVYPTNPLTRNSLRNIAFIVISLFLLSCSNSDDGDDKKNEATENVPSITEFSAPGTTIVLGESAELLAIFNNGTGSIDNGVGPVTSNVALTVTPAETTTYTLSVTNTNAESVSQSLTITVLPEPPPSPVITSFSVSQSTIVLGESTEITALFEHGDGGTASIDNEIGEVFSGQIISVSPASTTTYTISVSNSLLETVTASVTITVVPPPDPAISEFSANMSVITLGDSASLTANFSNGTAVIDNGVGSISNNDPVLVAPDSTTTYTLTVTNAAMVTVTASVTITVVSPPAISSFTATKTTIVEGDSVDLTAEFNNGTATINNGIGEVSSGMPVTVSPTATTTFELSVTNSAGTSVAATVTITVEPPPPSISSFSASQSTILEGDNIDLTAEFENGTGEIDNGVGGVTSGLPVTVSPTVTTTYTLTVSNAAMSSVTSSLTVTVNAGAKFSTTATQPAIWRGSHRATLLQNGKVLITGGFNQETQTRLNSADIYDPAINGFYNKLPLMVSVRSGHTATLLANGKVLVTGGNMSPGTSTVATNTAEIYDPATNIFTSTGNMARPRLGHTATLLPDGNVIIIGGYDTSSSSVSNGVEIYLTKLGIFAILKGQPPMKVARYNHQISKLNNGKYLITGGITNAISPDPIRRPVNSAEIFDPSDYTFTLTDSMSEARSSHVSTTLGSGKVLVQGGSTAELYNPTTGQFEPTGTPILPDSAPFTWYAYDATLLDNGRVLLVGRTSNAIDSQLYNPSTGEFNYTANTLQYTHSSPTVTRLGNDDVLVYGAGKAEIYK